jgi:large repetitive protein
MRKTVSRLLSTAGPILIVACPAAVLAQVAINTARVVAPASSFEALVSNNEASDSDALLAVLAASNDSTGPINGANGGTNAGNILTNDTLNGLAPTPGNVTISITALASNPGVVLDPATGNISVAPGVPAGTYTIVYQICETINPANCATATVSVIVTAPAIAATNDAPAPVNGTNGGNDIINAFANDVLNNTPVILSAITATITSPATSINGGPVPVLDPATGLVDVPAGTPAGSYTINYQICENNNPANCAIASITVVVDAAAIAASDDNGGPVNGANGAADVINVLGNDVLNSLAPTLANIILTITTPASNLGVTLDPATGNVSVAAGTPAGTYSIAYKICERLNPTNCADAIASVVVSAPAIAATDDAAPTVNGANGGTDVINAFANDMLNGIPVVASAITASILTPATSIGGGPVPLLDPLTGLVAVPSGTPAGSYTISYRICENNNLSNCANATITVIVTAPAIAASDDTYSAIRSGIGNVNAGNVLTNDMLNGAAIIPANIALRILAPASNPGVALDLATGQIAVDPSVPAGTYIIAYEICERLNPLNCAQATATIVVEPALSSVTGIVYEDRNGNGMLDSGETRRDGWIVEIIRDSVVVDTTRTDSLGNYRFDGLLSGGGYSIQFRNPDNNVVYQVIRDVTLANNTVVVDQNLPIDPSGVVYDSITRAPVRNAVVSLFGANGVPLPGSCFLSASQQAQSTDATGFYRFDVVGGASPLCPVGDTTYTISITPPTGYSAPSSVLPAELGAFDPTGLGAPVLIGASSNAPANGELVRWYQSFRLAQGDPDVIFNHIPLDPFLIRSPLVVTKTSVKRSANIGDLIPYTITVRNSEAAQRAPVDVIDILPPGIKYVTGTASVNGVAVEPQVNDRELRWLRQTIPASGTVIYKLTTVVGAGVTNGDRVNTGVARNGLDASEISNRGQAVVTIVPSAIFDCSELIGKVYDDLNGNGYQDKDEPGIPGARVVTVNGELITTDEFGRYHIACAAVPDAQIGSNFVLKLDVRTIARGYAPTTDNPQSIRLTRGKVSELNFGVQKAATTTIDLDSNAFVSGSAALRPEIAKKLATLRPAEAMRMVIQINYRAQNGEDWPLAEQRVAAVKSALTELFTKDWDVAAPTIEANLTRAFGMPGRE